MKTIQNSYSVGRDLLKWQNNFFRVWTNPIINKKYLKTKHIKNQIKLTIQTVEKRKILHQYLEYLATHNIFFFLISNASKT